MNKRENLLTNLKNDTYCRIGKSSIHGVGVIAIKTIPKGVDPFRITGNRSINYKCIAVSQKEINSLNPTVKKLVTDFIHVDENNMYFIPYYGMNSIDITFYMNHSKNNNISVKSSSKNEYMIFYANKIINEGDELFINYKDY
jgi:hypothetical protein